MKKLAFGLVTVLGGSVGIFSLTAARYEEILRPNTKVGPILVGGLAPEEAARRVRAWWEAEKLKPLELQTEGLKKPLDPVRPGMLGVTLDDVAAIADVPRQSFLDNTQDRVSNTEYPEEQYPLKYKPTGYRPLELIEKVKAAAGTPRPASVKFDKGTIFRTTEETLVKLDESSLYEAAVSALTSGEPVKLPLVKAPKRVPDEDLAQIHEIVSEFSTRFSAGNRPRSSNIRLAASKIDGLILMPGERLSFNDVVGRRTLKAGFKEAGVYLNGRHDTGIGGGICQVSTTLYNAALFANLGIRRRSNHSMPVPYVPVGRDATVDYGNLDLVLENTYPHPIAIDSQYKPGRLTFRVLGTQIPGLTVKVEQSGHKTFPAPEKRVPDPSLPAGKTRVLESGSLGHSIQTFRLVFQDGKLVKRQPLGRSYYGGGKRIVAVGTQPVAVVPVRDANTFVSPPVNGG